MQKIMFNDRYGLTDAVLRGSKTQTRRTEFKHDEQAELINLDTSGFTPIVDDNKVVVRSAGGVVLFCKKTRYKVGEVVAVAQSYKVLCYAPIALDRSPKDWRVVRGTLGESQGWNNKMYVRADACKHHIRITGIRVQRLQDISEDDCKAEGVDYVNGYSESYFFGFGVETDKGWIKLGNTPRSAYAALIDRVSGKGTFGRNPFVVAYKFEFVD